MQTHQLERMLRLANKTGGKLIITDSDGNRPVVILGLDEYEALLDGEKAPETVRRSSRAESRANSTTDNRQPKAAVIPAEDEDDGDDEADVTAMEEALLAVEESMPEVIAEEPKVVPVKAFEAESDEMPVPQEVAKERPATVLPIESPTEVGEEQFYLEPL